jgi:MFS family permease
MTGMRMAAPLMALRSGQSPVAVGVLLALFALTQVFLALPAGRYADLHGLKRPVMWSVLTSFVGAGMAAVWPIFPVLCVSALLTGGATGAAVIALQRHVGRAAQDLTQLKQAFSWLAIGPAISNFIGPFTAGLLIDHAGFQWAYGAMAVLPLLTWVWVRKTPELPSYIKPEGHENNSAGDL